MRIPRILLAAGSSGSGKTLITCGILQALQNRGLQVASFKCGPDYIDPMFHSRVIGTKSANLDTFFTSRERTRYLLAANAAQCDLAVMEGVMGYYDGVGGTTTRASAYDLADTTDTPVILIVDCKGMSLSLAAYVKGFLTYREDSHIKGVILNRMSPMLYPRVKAVLEELGVQVLGYVPELKDFVLESRHLGLVLPEEVPMLREQLQGLAKVLEESLDMEGILALAAQAPELDVTCPGAEALVGEDDAFSYRVPKPVRIGLAEDEAFCFIYKDNIRLLKEMGAEIVSFSPLHDDTLPENLDGLLLYGGYPELHAQELEDNRAMREKIAELLGQGMPCMAECGGFMYLHEEMEDMDGTAHQMTGVIPGLAFRTGKLGRFGYITLKNKEEDGTSEVLKPEWLGEIPAHEFHYFDSTNCGADFHASKPESSRGWDCMHRTDRLLAGFPHLYYYGNPKVPREFLKKCLQYQEERKAGRGMS